MIRPSGLELSLQAGRARLRRLRRGQTGLVVH